MCVGMRATWDGQPVSDAPPFGATIVVFRRQGAATEVLLLHRAHHGPDYAGEWAWTPPAGARLPGEPIEVCAQRELREETGLDLPLQPTECGSAEWPHYLAEAPGDAAIRLDVEHDRFEWAAADEAPLRCLPDLTRLPLRAAIERIQGQGALGGGAFYDQARVFDTYMAHRARPESPNEAIEGPVFVEVLGSVRGLRVLDLGCGDGSLGQRLLDAGCASYSGIDASRRMVERAGGAVRHMRIEDFTAEPGSADIVVSRLALHYVEDLESVFANVRRALSAHGRFIFSVEHPVITSTDRAWQGRGQRQEWVVDDYFVTGRRETDWLGARVVKFHRTVEEYVRLVQTAGFRLETLREPGPTRAFIESEDEFRRRQRIPLFVLIAAVAE
jgi:SAM-dependent methyltransferase/8-oxo-dGTP pyrophosphatase MutT (NUDIX family)